MNGAHYLMEADFGDLAYAIAILIMAGATGVAGHFKKKKKQAELQEELARRVRRPAKTEAKPPPKGLEEWIEVLLPKQMRPPRQPRAPRPEPGRGEAPGVAPTVAPAKRAAPPSIESPLRPPTGRMPVRPAPARPVAPPPLEPGEHVSAQRIHDATERLTRPTGPAKRPVYLPKTYNAQELRKAIIMSEILGKPIALREDTGS